MGTLIFHHQFKKKYTFSIDINKSLNRLDMSDYSKLDKTMLNYLIISLSNLKRKKKKTQSGVLSECLGQFCCYK